MKVFAGVRAAAGPAVVFVVAGGLAGGVAQGAPAGHAARAAQAQVIMKPDFRIKVLGHYRDGKAVIFASKPKGLPPHAIESVYHLTTTNSSGAGQTIAIVDAFRDPAALSDLNTFSKQYGLPQLATCTSLSQSGACFAQEYPQGTPTVSADWVYEQSMDIEAAHAMAPAAKIVLVDTTGAGATSLYGGVTYANTLNPDEVSTSWGGFEGKKEASHDPDFTHPGTLYTASSGDFGGPYVQYPAASPHVLAVGGTTLAGCSGTSCAGFVLEEAWTGSGGGASKYESLPSYQSSYTGPVYSASAISALTGGKRGTPDVSFEADPETGPSIYDSTKYNGQSGWSVGGGTSFGAPSWAGILAAGAAAGKTALQGDAAIYGGGYKTNLRDITDGTTGTCGTDCTAGTGYDLTTGLGSPINYP